MEPGPIPIDGLDRFNAIRDGHGKAIAIVRSSMALVSIFASSNLIWMIRRSYIGLTNTYHRLLLGMSVADIIFSLGIGHFNFASPSDTNYLVWNARGNQVTCSLTGFLGTMGVYLGMLYMCSLNLYYVAVIKYQKPKHYIIKKIEPFLHGAPLAVALISNIILVAMRNFNDNGTGFCRSAIYEAPHCIGYEDFEVREGFNIPCRRGSDGAVSFSYVMFFVITLITPIVVGVSLALIYRAVSQQEKKSARYGNHGATSPTNPSTQNSSTSAEGEAGNHKPSVRISSKIFGMNKTSSSQKKHTSKSRAVMHKAFAYSAAYFLAWIFPVVGNVLAAAGVKWPIIIVYFTVILNPLQGFFNFVIFMYPKVLSKRQKQPETTWCQAINEAFWSRGIDNRRGVRPPPVNHVQQERKERKPPQDEEEKTEIQPHQSPLYSEEVNLKGGDVGSGENMSQV